jgi:hypothetical protein
MTELDGERVCPECEGRMILEHDGRFTTLYVCRGCGSMLTIPPARPLTSATDLRSVAPSRNPLRKRSTT